jgi:hypothetical protein
MARVFVNHRGSPRRHLRLSRVNITAIGFLIVAALSSWWSGPSLACWPLIALIALGPLYQPEAAALHRAEGLGIETIMGDRHNTTEPTSGF